MTEDQVARTTKTRDAAPAKQEVLAAAAKAFRKHGVESATMDDIAEELGATKGRIYHYYRSKTAVLLDIHVFAMEMVIGETTPAATTPGPALERLRNLILAMVRLNAREIDLLHVVISSLFNGLPHSSRAAENNIRSRVLELRREFEQMLVSIVEDGVRSGEFRNVDARTVARACLGALQWTVLWLGSTKHPLETTADELADYLITGLVPSPHDS